MVGYRPHRHVSPFGIGEYPRHDFGDVGILARIAVQGIGREAVPLSISQRTWYHFCRHFPPAQRSPGRDPMEAIGQPIALPVKEDRYRRELPPLFDKSLVPFRDIHVDVVSRLGPAVNPDQVDCQIPHVASSPFSHARRGSIGTRTRRPILTTLMSPACTSSLNFVRPMPTIFIASSRLTFKGCWGCWN